MQLIAQSYSLRASNWLSTNNIACVFSSFDKALNLISKTGKLFAVVDCESGNGPFTAVVKDLPCRLNSIVSQGDLVIINQDCLTVNSITIDFSSAMIWCASPDWKYLNKNSPVILEKSDIVIEIIRHKSYRNSLASILFSTNNYNDFICTKISKSAEDMFSGISLGDPIKLRDGVAGIAGLGMGLTPSGDDFLIGVLHALWLMCDLLYAQKLSNSIVEIAISRTNRLSSSWLSEASKGFASEGWHKLLNALVSSNKNDIEEACKNVLAVGSTSGSDALTGFLLTIKYLGFGTKYKGEMGN